MAGKMTLRVVSDAGLVSYLRLDFDQLMALSDEVKFLIDQYPGERVEEWYGQAVVHSVSPRGSRP